MKYVKIALLIACLLVVSCARKNTDGGGGSNIDIQESAQQIGESMSAIDEIGGGSNGQYALRLDADKTFARYESGGAGRRELIWDRFIPEARAASCSVGRTLGACSSSQRVISFNDCTVGAATFSGGVTLSWSGTGAGVCQLSAQNDSVSRNPNFTATGLRGATLTVSKVGTNGQTLTRGVSAGSYSFSSDGIRRVFTTASSTTLFDFTTQTTQTLTVTGTSRASRVLSGGNIRITNNLNSVTCDVAPTAVTWTNGCNCATSGQWSGSCSDGKEFSLNITGCGSASFTLGTETETVSFNRCYQD